MKDARERGQVNKCCRDNIDKILPPESLSRAKVNGAFYESEFDEGWNACLKEINSRILNLMAFCDIKNNKYKDKK